MKLLYSNILPLGIEDTQQTIIDCFTEQMSQADRVEIAVGYISTASVNELANMVEKCGIKSGTGGKAACFLLMRFCERILK